MWLCTYRAQRRPHVPPSPYTVSHRLVNHHRLAGQWVSAASVLGSTSTCYHTWRFVKVLGVEFWSFCLHSKYFSNWAISPARALVIFWRQGPAVYLILLLQPGVLDLQAPPTMLSWELWKLYCRLPLPCIKFQGILGYCRDIMREEMWNCVWSWPWGLMHCSDEKEERKRLKSFGSRIVGWPSCSTFPGWYQQMTTYPR